MATITLTADTDYSALTVANDDTIDCAGFILTLDVAPTETGVQVTSPATNGRVVFSNGWNLSTWDFFAGNNAFTGMVVEIPSGATIKSITGGAGTNNRGVGTNNGTILTVNGGTGGTAIGLNLNNGTVTTANTGSGTNAQGVSTNNGTITTANAGATAHTSCVNNNNGTVTTANAGSASSAFGVNENNGTITTANGGTATNAHGVSINNGTITTANAGTVGFTFGAGTNNGTVITSQAGGVSNAHGLSINNGTVVTANGGTNAGAYGIAFNNGLCLRLTDNTGKAVNAWRGSRCFVEGPHIAGIIPNNIKTIYSFGTLSGSATIAGDADVITLSEGGGAARPVNPFTQQVIG